MRKLQNLPITFTQRDYRETPDDVLVYADPPYILTKSYSKRTFDFLAFRQWVLARKGPTFVSELTMPATLQVVWEQSYKSQMTSNKPGGGRIINRVEKLYFKPQSLSPSLGTAPTANHDRNPRGS